MRNFPSANSERRPGGRGVRGAGGHPKCGARDEAGTSARGFYGFSMDLKWVWINTY